MDSSDLVPLSLAKLPKHLRPETPSAMQSKCSLREHQKIALAWLMQMESGDSEGGILADDMGLGKTISIPALLHTNRPTEQSDKTTLIVAPLAVLQQWSAEIQAKTNVDNRFSIFTYHGNNKTDHTTLRGFDIVLTTYGALASEYRKYVHNRDREDAVQEESFPFHGNTARFFRIILDEARIIRNKNTESAMATYEIVARYRFCLSGTPIMNRLLELASLIHFLQIEPYNDFKKFRKAFGSIMDVIDSPQRKLAITKLQETVRPFLLRRTITSSIDGKPIVLLPPLTQQTIFVEMDTQELSRYTTLKDANTQPTSDHQGIAPFITRLMRLRQAACHGQLVPSETALESLLDSGDENIDHENIDNENIDDDDSVLEQTLPYTVAEQVVPLSMAEKGKNTVRNSDVDLPEFRRIWLPSMHRTRNNKRKVPPIEHNNSTKREVSSNNPIQADTIRILEAKKKSFVPSTKTRTCMDILKNTAPNVKTIIFSQWTQLLDLLATSLELNHNLQYECYTGSMHSDARLQAIWRFEQDPTVSVMLMTITAGNAGLNLTVANQMIIMEPQWNPYVEMQAISRIYRMGQCSPTKVYRIIVRNTVEEGIVELQKRKRGLIDDELLVSDVSLSKRDIETLLNGDQSSIGESCV